MTRKYQEGGQLTDTQQQGLQYLAQMYAQQTGKDPQQDQEGFMQFVQQLAQQAGVQDIGQLLDMVYQQAQGQAQAARRGAKLNYLRKLTGKCPEGYELQYFKAGGRVCSKCVAKKKVQSDKCGNKVKKNCFGKKMIKAQTGTIFNKIKSNVKKLPIVGQMYPFAKQMYDTFRQNRYPEVSKPSGYWLDELVVYPDKKSSYGGGIGHSGGVTLGPYSDTEIYGMTKHPQVISYGEKYPDDPYWNYTEKEYIVPTSTYTPPGFEPNNYQYPSYAVTRRIYPNQADTVYTAQNDEGFRGDVQVVDAHTKSNNPVTKIKSNLLKNLWNTVDKRYSETGGVR